MSRRISDKLCKEIIRDLAQKFKVNPPSLITTKLMSEEDKNDLRNGDLTIETLTCAVQVWLKAGMTDYRNGNINKKMII